MIDLGFSENEMIDECRPLTLFDVDFKKIFNENVKFYVYVIATHTHTRTLSLNNFFGFKFDAILNFVFVSVSILERDIEMD